MASRRRQEDVLRFHGFLLQLRKVLWKQLVSFYQTDRVHLINEGHTNPLEKLWDQNGAFFIVEKMRYEETSSLEEWQNGEPSVSEAFPKENLSVSPLALSRASIKYSSPVSDNNYSIGLKELKENHRMRHHASDLTIAGFARYEFLESTSLDSLTQEDSLIPLERNIYADFAWEGVKKMLQTPPPSSTALLSLAETLKNGVIKWPKALGRKSAVELVQKLLKDLKDEVDGLKSHNEDDTEVFDKIDNTAAVIGSMKTLFGQRGDLDFLELLWCNIWRNVASHEELVECFSLVIRALQHGELQTWIHQESNSLLSKLIKQSYHGKVETVSLDGDSPVQMLLEIGVDKMKRDYISYFVVDLQERVHRIQKLHHMLEIVDNCLDLIKLEHENLIFLTQSCINYYKENPLNEKHAFQLPVKTSLVKEFYQNAHPQIWRVEISSGQGPKRVKTIWQLSSTPPAEHKPANGDSLDDTEICGNKEKYFITLSECSQVDFI
ncbi:putative Zwilch kinetochore associated-like protein [Naja naja]|nr:putative Zwilch kinetochore associated-like protein [Naja naja]